MKKAHALKTTDNKQKEQGRKNAALGGSSADGLGFRDMFPQLHALLPIRQEVYDPPAGGVGHMELVELVLKQSWEDGVGSRAELKSTNRILAYVPGESRC